MTYMDVPKFSIFIKCLKMPKNPKRPNNQSADMALNVSYTMYFN